MLEDWKKEVKPGDFLRIKALWNNTERRYRQVPVPVEVLEIKECVGCQSGLLFKVLSKTEKILWLDSGWFHKPNGKYPTEGLFY